MRSLGDVGAVVTNMVMGVAGSGGSGGGGASGTQASPLGGPASTPAAGPSLSLARQDSTAAALQTGVAGSAGGSGSGSSEKQDTLIMDTKLKIIEILQVRLRTRHLLYRSTYNCFRSLCTRMHFPIARSNH